MIRAACAKPGTSRAAPSRIVGKAFFTRVKLAQYLRRRRARLQKNCGRSVPAFSAVAHRQ